jgi:hypothetical protein
VHEFSLLVIDGELAARAVLAWPVMITVGCMRADELPSPSLLELAAPEALAEQRALVLGDRPLDLEQELVTRVVGDGVGEELDRTSRSAELFQQEHLVGVAPGQPVGGKNGDNIDFTVAHRVAQGVQAKPVETRSAVSLIAEYMGVSQLVVLNFGPGSQGVELAVDGLLAFLTFGGNAGVDGGAHGAPPMRG